MKTKSLDENPELLAELRAQCKRQYLAVREEEKKEKAAKAKVVKLPRPSQRTRPAFEM